MIKEINLINQAEDFVRNAQNYVDDQDFISLKKAVEDYCEGGSVKAKVWELLHILQGSYISNHVSTLLDAIQLLATSEIPHSPIRDLAYRFTHIRGVRSERYAEYRKLEREDVLDFCGSKTTEEKMWEILADFLDQEARLVMLRVLCQMFTPEERISSSKGKKAKNTTSKKQ